MPDDGKVVRKLVNSNSTSSRIFWKVIWKHLLSHKIIGTLWPNGHTPWNPKVHCPKMLEQQRKI